MHPIDCAPLVYTVKMQLTKFLLLPVSTRGTERSEHPFCLLTLFWPAMGPILGPCRHQDPATEMEGFCTAYYGKDWGKTKTFSSRPSMPLIWPFWQCYLGPKNGGTELNILCHAKISIYNDVKSVLPPADFLLF